MLFLSPLLAGAEKIVEEASSTEVASSVPESSVAILLGGVLWFLLLRKRA